MTVRKRQVTTCLNNVFRNVMLTMSSGISTAPEGAEGSSCNAGSVWPGLQGVHIVRYRLANLSEMVVFSYASIESSFREKVLQEIRVMGYGDKAIPWVATEKVCLP